MSSKKFHKVIDHGVVLEDYSAMSDTLHNLTVTILDKIFQGLEKAVKSMTRDEIAEVCNTSAETVIRLLNKKRGTNPERFTLNMAIKLWEGLGHSPETLIADCNIDPAQAAKIKKIESSPVSELLTLMIEVLADHDMVNPVYLGDIKSKLELIKLGIDDAKQMKDAQEPPPQPIERRINKDPYHGPDRRKKVA